MSCNPDERRQSSTAATSEGVNAEAGALAQGYVTVTDGARLHYVEAGRGEAMLLVPGWMATARFWEPQLHYFARRHRVVALDPRSQGESTKTSDGNCIERRARDIHEVLTHLALQPAVIVAWSMAVPDALSMAHQFGPANIRALVLIDGPIVAWSQDPAALAQLVAVTKRMQMARREFNDEMVRRLFRKPQPEARYRTLAAEMLKTPTDTAVAMQIDSLYFDYRAALRALERPVMFVGRGEQSEPQVKLFRAERPHDRVEILPGCGHALFLDDPDRFNAAVDDFLSCAPSH